MATVYDPSLNGLDDCGGCSGVAAETPVRVHNRAGLDGFGYRIGTHARFLASMLARLSNRDKAALARLRTRDPSDLTIAFLDACAAVDDGLTFYTERFAHEWYVRSARERVSLVQLARLIGYEPRPGVAAGASLAFTIEDTPGTPELTAVEAGTKVMSIPGKNELPQTFETTRAIEARSVWNAMRVRTHAPQRIHTEMTQAVLQGIESGIRRGDSVLIVVVDESGAHTEVKRVRSVVADAPAGQTKLELADAPAPSAAPRSWLADHLGTLYYPELTNQAMSHIFTGRVYSASLATTISNIFDWSSYSFAAAANASPPPPPPAQTGVFALRQRAAIFGHNAPKWKTMPQTVVDGGNSVQLPGKELTERLRHTTHDADERKKWQYPDDWDDLDLKDDPNPGSSRAIDLDNTYSTITEDSWVVLEGPDSGQDARAYRVMKNQELTRNDYALSVKVSRLTLDSSADLDKYKMRKTTVLAQSDRLPLAKVPLTVVDSGQVKPAPVEGASLTLDKYYPGLVPGQQVVVSGTRLDLYGVPASEVRTLADAQVDGTLEAGRLFTVLKLTEPLRYVYDAASVTVNANVVPSTHGETKREVLGGGDGARRYQRFVLKQMPLTYVSAGTATGAASTLQVRVNGVLWSEVPSLHGRAPDEQVYVVRHEDDGRSYVQFNAPLPSGKENVVATYRVGIGRAGVLKPGQLSLLTVRPLGVRGVTNPLASSGAEDRESIDALRDNSPLTVLTLDRLVSLQDYEHFARAFAGFSKAQAVPTADGSQQGVFLTVAGQSGVVDESSAEFGNLVSAIRASGDPHVAVVVEPYRPAFFQVDATVGVDARYEQKHVADHVKAALAQAFSFEARSLRQSVTAVQVIAVIQSVPGVVYVDLNALHRVDPHDLDAPKSWNSVLLAQGTEPGESRFTSQAAELLILNPARPADIATVQV